MGIAALVAASCLAWGLPAYAQASSGPNEVQTEPAEVTANGGLLKGKLNPGELPTTYYFQYVHGEPGSCECKPQMTAVAGPLTGSTLQEVPPVEITGLIPEEKYTYWLIASNADGTRAGGAIEFTTAATTGKPSIESTSVSDVTQTSARLEAKIDPKGLQNGVYYQFQLVTNTSEYRSEIVCSENKVYPIEHDGCMRTPISGALPIRFLESGTEGKAVYEEQSPYGYGTPLKPGTTYHFRVLAAKALATKGTVTWEGPPVYGPEQTFTTHPAAAEPSIESESVSHVTQNDATLDAKINPEGLRYGTYYQFQFVKNTSEYLPKLVCPEESVQPGPGGEGNCERIWNPQRVPGAMPIGFVESGSDGYIEPGQESQSVSQGLAAAGVTLQPDTTYHYRVLAANGSFGEEGGSWSTNGPFVEGSDQTFTTPPASAAPEIGSVSISHLTPTNATLEATINTEGLETTYQFVLQPEPSCTYHGVVYCELVSPPIALPSGKLLGSFVGQSVSVDLNRAGVTLHPGEYSFTVKATSAAGSTEGPSQTFEAPSGVFKPLSTTTLPLSGAVQPAGSNTNSGDQPTDSGGARAPGVTPLRRQIVCVCNCARGCHGKKVSAKYSARTQKLSKALKACEKKSKTQRPSCKREAQQKYAATGKHRL